VTFVLTPPTRPLRLLLAVLLTALLPACGGSQTNDRQFIAKSRSATLVRSVDRIEADLQSKDCNGALASVARVRAQVARLPSSYNGRLIGNITQWIDYLDSRIPADCNKTAKPKASATPDETTTPTPTPAETETPTPTPDKTATPEPTSTPVPIPTPDANNGGSQSPDAGGVPPADPGQ
jgi:uncharacterized membrane-anchored protein